MYSKVHVALGVCFSIAQAHGTTSWTPYEISKVGTFTFCCTCFCFVFVFVYSHHIFTYTRTYIYILFPCKGLTLFYLMY